MPKTRAQKEDTVAKLTDKFSKANSVVFTDYTGMTMSDLMEMRQKLREISAEFTITKNNLVEIALKNAGLELTDDKVLAGQTATLFAFGDEVAPIAELTKALKASQKGEIKAGFVNGEMINKARVIQLSTLPSKDQLRGQVVGALGAPLYGIVGVLQANLRNLVYTLDQIRLQKGGEA
jgi:large subunit ribosomal protein L10